MVDRDPKNHPIHEYSNLTDLLGDAARKLGLYLQGAAVIPPPKDSDAPVMMQVSFAVGEVAVDRALDPEQADMDDEFMKIIQGDKETEADRVARELAEEFKNGKGIFGDDT